MPSLQEALSAAFDKEAAEIEEPSAPVEGSQNEPLPEEQPAEEVKESASRERDEATGKFKARNKDAVSPPKEQTEKEVKPAVQAPAVRAPVSWRPEVREKFGALPPEIQNEVSRREREIENGLREAAGSRRFFEEFARAVQPYEAMLRSEQATPLEAVSGLLNTAYQLRTATPQNKAALVAKIINDFGVNIEMLDNILSAQVDPQQQRTTPDMTSAYVEQQLAPVKQFMERFSGMEQRAQTVSNERAAQAIEEFKKDPEVAEFYEDVSPDMADILEIAVRRGQKLTLREAFNRATMLHPEISKILADRKVAKTAQQASSAASRARNASASLPSGSAPEPGDGKPVNTKNLASVIEHAWDTVAARES